VTGVQTYALPIYEFDVGSVRLLYYRRPTDIQIQGCINLSTQLTNITNIDCEFKDDIAEVLVDYAASILAGDTELFNTMSRTQQSATSGS